VKLLSKAGEGETKVSGRMLGRGTTASSAQTTKEAASGVPVARDG
jgi:hypothetical protein